MKSPAPTIIAWLLSGTEDYGVRRTTLGFIRELGVRGVRSRAIVLGPGSMADDLDAEGVEPVRIGSTRAPPTVGGSLPRKVINGLRMLRYGTVMRQPLADAVRDAEADVLHVRWPHLVGLAGAAGRRAGARVVWQMPNLVGTTLPFGLNRRYLRYLCWRYGILPLANSRYTASTLAPSGPPPPFAHLGIDPAAFDPAAHRPAPLADLGIPVDSPVAGVFARLQPSKGQAQLIEAVASLAEEAPDLHLLVVGGRYHSTPAFEDELHALAEQHAIADRVHFVGRVSEPQPYYLACDVVVSSTQGPEPFGLSVIEAMMMGRPVLAHALGGPAETVRDGDTGWLVPNGRAHDLAAGLRRALDDRPRWQEMRAAARAHATANFTLARAVDRYLDALARGDRWP